MRRQWRRALRENAERLMPYRGRDNLPRGWRHAGRLKAPYDPVYCSLCPWAFLRVLMTLLRSMPWDDEELADDGEEPEHLCRTTTNTVVEGAAEGESSRLRKLLSKLA